MKFLTEHEREFYARKVSDRVQAGAMYIMDGDLTDFALEDLTRCAEAKTESMATRDFFKDYPDRFRVVERKNDFLISCK
jgi:hypothetical protein